MATPESVDAETARLAEDARREKDWKRWGPYLAERQWGTVREDYSADGTCWEYFPHDHARSRAYRWGEDGLLGLTDRQGRLCFSLALWNGRDPILKERLFGLTGPQGNHGEDVKECYFYLDSTPTHSYMKALYKYPQAEFPYSRLVEENRRRGREQGEFEVQDTGVFEEGRYFDVFVEYAKNTPNDIAVRITAINRGPDAATLHLLPTLWFRNTWSWNREGEGYYPKPRLERVDERTILAEHASLGRFRFALDNPAPLLFTENESNFARLYGVPNVGPHVKDAFHDYVIHGKTESVNRGGTGTKAAAHYAFELAPQDQVILRLRLTDVQEAQEEDFGLGFERIFEDRLREANEFFAPRLPYVLTGEQRRIARQAYAGLLWSKQFYHYIVKDWLEGDPPHLPPESRRAGRNRDWKNIYARDVISMPDKWEYPWFAVWDLAFHMIPYATIDPEFAKEQLILMLREWYAHANGKLPSYEFAFGDVNPPVHAWSAWRVYKMTAPRGKRDRVFLERVFQKLLINFTWWVNRKDPEGNHIFSGGFLGLDNIGIFDRSKPLPMGGSLEQADGTAWMAFYCGTMLSIALELAREDPAYEDIASKFFEHYVAIADAMNSFGGTGLWDETDGFYYDRIRLEDRVIPMRVRSMVGLIPLIAVENIEKSTIERLPGFAKRLKWFLDYRQDLATHISCMSCEGGHTDRLLAIPTRERLLRVLRYLLDEKEFLSPYGIRSLSRIHHDHPFVLRVDGQEHGVAYDPAESTTGIFGGNSNWRGPVWFPVNFLLIEALERYHHFYGDDLQVECPTGSGRRMSLHEVARELQRRLTRLFLPDEKGRRPCHGDDPRFAGDPYWKDLLLFHEYFHGDTGRGLGANHQTGWTSLITRCFEPPAPAVTSVRPARRT